MKHIYVILDKSGSMNKILEATIDGYNEFLNEQKKVYPESKWHLITFHSEVDKCISNTIENIEGLTMETYKPDGLTCLYDAIGYMYELSSETPGEHICIVITDGHDNASQNYSRQHIQQFISERKSENWKFIFCGATSDYIIEGKQLGFEKKDIHHFNQEAPEVTNLFRSLSSEISPTRSDQRPTLQIPSLQRNTSSLSS